MKQLGDAAEGVYLEAHIDYGQYGAFGADYSVQFDGPYGGIYRANDEGVDCPGGGLLHMTTLQPLVFDADAPDQLDKWSLSEIVSGKVLMKDHVGNEATVTLDRQSNRIWVSLNGNSPMEFTYEGDYDEEFGGRLRQCQ